MDKQNSKEKIIKAGKDEFISKGFKDASLRQIAKKAGVTTGAIYAHFKDKEALFEELISPATTIMEDLFNNTSKEYKSLFYEAPKLKYIIWDKASERMKNHIEDIYKDYDAFKLLLCCSEGTKYSDFIFKLINESILGTKDYFRYLENKGIKIHQLSDRELEVLIHTHFSSIYEVVRRDMSYDEAKTYIDTINDFFSAGWMKILNFTV